MTRYVILDSHDRTVLEAQVQALLNTGWRLHGGVTMCSHVLNVAKETDERVEFSYAQALTWEEH